MAIVDIKHVQTIEEAFSQVAGGGSGGGVFKVTAAMADDKTVTLDKTYSDIYSAIDGGAFVFVLLPEDIGYSQYYFENMTHEDSGYFVNIFNHNDGELAFASSTEDGVLTYTPE